jgi:predicted RNA-binding Zn-ribbon protein involved in translation (DUF1610 family)
MAEVFGYFDEEWREAPFTCRNCGWTGPSSEMANEPFRDLMDFSCPRCDTMLLIVNWPTLEDTRAAAAAGNAEAQRELARREDPPSRRGD